MIEIRPAGPDDVEAAARCHRECWSQGYAGLFSDEQLTELNSELSHRKRIWERMIAGAPPPLVALDDGSVIGIASAGAGRDDDTDLDLELTLIYVRKSHWGTGVGHRLLEAAIADHPAYLWVFKDNTRALRFYERHGFSADGTEKPHPRWGLIEIRLVRHPQAANT